jgi:hypothetical protein
MIAPRRVASTSPLLVASALAAASLLAPGCGGGDDPAGYARTIELPKREMSRVNAKELAKSKTPGPASKR